MYQTTNRHMYAHRTTITVNNCKYHYSISKDTPRIINTRGYNLNKSMRPLLVLKAPIVENNYISVTQEY